MSRSRSNHEPRPRNRGIGNRPKLWLEITTVVLESTDPRGKGRAKLQRFSDGGLRILLLEQMGRAATHGYIVGYQQMRCDDENITLFAGEERYVIPYADCKAASEMEAYKEHQKRRIQ